MLDRYKMRLFVWISLLSALGAFSSGFYRKGGHDASRSRSAVSSMYGRDILDGLGTVFDRPNFDRVQLSTALARVAVYSESSDDARTYVRTHPSWPKMVAKAVDNCREGERGRGGGTTSSQMGGSEIADDLSLSRDLQSIAKVHRGVGISSSTAMRGAGQDFPDVVRHGFGVLSAELTRRLRHSAQRFQVASGPGILARALWAHATLGFGTKDLGAGGRHPKLGVQRETQEL